MSNKFIDKLYRHNVLRQGPEGLVHVRGGSLISRRTLGKGVLAGAAVAALSPILSAYAATSTTVNFMGWQGYEEGLSVGGYLKQNGYTMSNTYITDNNQIIATALGGGMGSMDIVTPDHGYTPVMAQIGILQELDIERLPNYHNLLDFFKMAPGPNVNGKHFSLPYTWGSTPLMYNPKFVKEKPTSWLDIMNPAYKGKAALVNDVISVMIPFTMAATGTKTPTRINKDELEAALALIIEIKKNYVRTIASSYGELVDLFASGEVIIAQSWEPVSAWTLAKGVKLDWNVPKEGTWTLIDCLALITNSPHQAEAYDLINHGLSAEAQAHVANANSTAVTVGAAVPLLNEVTRDMYPYDDIPGFFETTGGGPFPLWPLDQEGDLVTFDDVLNAWERFLKA